MSTCHDEELLALARGELPPDQARIREAHVASCAACAEELELLRADVALFRARAARSDGPPPATWEAIARRIGPGAPIPIRRASSRRVVWYAAGAVALAARVFSQFTACILQADGGKETPRASSPHQARLGGSRRLLPV